MEGKREQNGGREGKKRRRKIEWGNGNRKRIKIFYGKESNNKDNGIGKVRVSDPDSDVFDADPKHWGR